MRKVAEFVLKYRWLVIVALIVILLITIPGLANLKVDNSLRIWFVESDPNIVAFNEFQKTFGGDEFIVVALKDENGVFVQRNLEIIRDMGQELREIRGISSVVSICDAVDIWRKGDAIVIGKLMEEVPETENEMEEFKVRVFSNPLYIGTLISEDGKTALINAFLMNINAIDQCRADIVNEVRAIAAKYEKIWGDKIYIAGTPILNVALNEYTLKDLYTFFPIAILLTVFTIFLTMRHWSAVFLALIIVGVCVGITMGIYTLMGRSMSMMTTIVPILIIVIGVADSIHIINHYFEQSRAGGTCKEEILIRTMTFIAVPCLMTTITTSVGFSVLGISQIFPVKEVGFFAALGILTAFIVTIAIIPITYSILPIPKKKKPWKKENDLICKVLNIFYHLIVKRTIPIAVAGTILFGASIFFITKINIETQYLDYFKEDDPLRKAYSFIEKNVGYISPIDFLIIGETGSAYEPRTIKEVRDFQEFLLSYPDISKTLAITNIIERINVALLYTIPQTRQGIALLLHQYEISPEGNLDSFMNFDASTLRVSGRSRTLNSNECKDLMKKTKEYFKENLPKDLEGRMTGIVPLLVYMVDYIIRSQIFSFSLAFILIFFLITIQLKSLKLGLISIIPNAMPIAITMGAMGLFGINLDTGTVMISAVAIGIAVDDTIHFLNRFKLELKNTGNYEKSIRVTLINTGRAIITTSIILFFGFWTLLFGSYKPTYYFGFLSGITILNVLVWDLLLLPAILLIFKPKI